MQYCSDVLSGSELLVVFAVLAVVLVVIVLAGARQQGRSDTGSGAVRTVVVPDAARPWLVGVAADLHALPRHSVAWLSPDVALVTWTRRSGWSVVLAIVLFPLGLLALLFATKEHGTITVVAQGPPGSIALGGRFSNAAVDAIDRHVAARTATPA